MISEKLSTDSRRMLQNGVPQFVGFCRCTPCRQRRGKDPVRARGQDHLPDAPRAGSAEAKWAMNDHNADRDGMHPVQAAPRQSTGKTKWRADHAGCTPCRQRRGKAARERAWPWAWQDAPRAGSAEAKVGCEHALTPAGKDAPRAGSAEAKVTRFAPAARSEDAPHAGSAEAKFSALVNAYCTA